MKKRFLLLAAMLLTLMGGGKFNALNAQETNPIGTGTGTTQNYPIPITKNYGTNQQIYSVNEIGSTNKDKVISAISFQKSSGTDSEVNNTRNIEVYVANIDEGVYLNDNFIKLQNSDLFYSGSYSTGTFDENGWMTITTNKNGCTYNGKNIVVCIIDKTGSYPQKKDSFLHTNFGGDTYWKGNSITRYYRGSNIDYALDITKEQTVGTKTAYRVNTKFTFSADAGGDDDEPTIAYPDEPNLISPSNEAAEQYLPKLNFTLDNITTHYQIYFGQDPKNLTAVTDEMTIKNDNNVIYDLIEQNLNYRENTDYYWKVVARNMDDASDATEPVITESKTYKFTTDIITAPEKITGISPENNTIYTNLYVQWENWGKYTYEYQVLYGTKGNMSVIQDWTTASDDKKTQDLPYLNFENNTKYYWQVNVRNVYNETTECGPYSFITKLNQPNNVLFDDEVYPDESTPTISWEHDQIDNEYSYKLYINDQIVDNITEPEYELTELEYGKNNIYITIVNIIDGDTFESTKQFSPFVVNVTDYVNVSGTITDSEENPLADATVSFVGKDDFGKDQSYNLFTNENGVFSSDLVLSGTYDVTISKNEYITHKIENYQAKYGQELDVINIQMELAGAIYNVNGEWNMDPANKDVIIEANAHANISYELTVKSIEIKENASLTLEEGAILTITGEFTNTDASKFIINDGAQIFQNNDNVAATFNMEIVKPTDDWNDSNNTTGWQFISSPFTNAKFEDFIPSTSDYDLYKYDGTQDYEWLNKKPYTVTIEGNNNSTHAAVPSHINYEYSLSQQIYLAEDLESKTGSITGFSFKTANETSNGIIRNFTVYMINTDKTSFETVKDWVSVKGLTPVFNGDVIYNTNDEWTTIKFDTPFEYTGNNIVLCINDNSNNYLYNATSYYTMNTSESRTLYIYSGSYINPTTMAFNGNLAQYVNNAQFIFDLSGDNTYNFQQGVGYLASYEKETTATLRGTMNAAKEKTWSFNTTYNEDNHMAKFFLLGNPFTFNMDLENLTWNNNVVEGVAIVNTNGGYKYSTVAEDNIATIPVGDGFFIKATGDNPSIIYRENRGNKKDNQQTSSINVIANGKAGKDNVVICFDGEKEGFDKLQNFNREIANIYVENNGNRYGIYNCDENTTEVELSFSASQMGTYSISFDINGDFENVVLVDRLTGIETNMLIEDEYEFVATSNDNAKRFFIRLDNGQQSTDNDSMFVYQSGEELIVNAEGSIEIIDMMGRVVYSSEVINNRINVSSLNKSAYIVRNINENTVRTQKIVIL